MRITNRVRHSRVKPRTPAGGQQINSLVVATRVPREVPIAAVSRAVHHAVGRQAEERITVGEHRVVEEGEAVVEIVAQQ